MKTADKLIKKNQILNWIYKMDTRSVDSVFYLIETKPELVQGQAIFAFLAENKQSYERYKTYLNSIVFKQDMSFTDALRLFCRFGFPKSMSRYCHEFSEIFVEKYFPIVSNKESFLTKTKSHEEDALSNKKRLYLLTFYTVWLVIEDKDHPSCLQYFIDTMIKSKANFGIDFLWSVFDDFRKNPIS